MSVGAAAAQLVAALVEVDGVLQRRLAAFEPGDDRLQFVQRFLEAQILDRSVGGHGSCYAAAGREGSRIRAHPRGVERTTNRGEASQVEIGRASCRERVCQYV